MKPSVKKGVGAVFTTAAVMTLPAFCTLSYAAESANAGEQIETERNIEDLYFDACEDAMKADADEIESLISITTDSSDVIWNESKDRALMLCFHHYPDSYPEGENVKLEWGEVWVTSAKEMEEWYKENKESVEDWTLRFQELLGLPFYGEYTNMTAMWVKPEDMFRPAYVTDIHSDEMTNTFEDEMEETFDQNYKAWFDDNIIDSYYDGAYPWTRLGYTYDWADNGTERGLCEFIARQDSEVIVEFTKETQDFLQWLESDEVMEVA